MQAGALASSPYPRWELTHHQSSLEGKSAELANIFLSTEATGAWQFGTAKDAYSNMTAHQDALSKNDAFQMEAIVYDYAPYTPIVHAFPVRAADVPREGLRVYDHGACPGFVLWDEISADLPYAVTKSIAEMAFCVEVFGGKAIDTMIRHALGFFPTFTRTPSTPYAIGGPAMASPSSPGSSSAQPPARTLAQPTTRAMESRRTARSRSIESSAPGGERDARLRHQSGLQQRAARSGSGEAINSSPKFVVRLPVAGLGAECSSGSTCDLAYPALRSGQGERTFRTARSASRSRSSLGSRRTTTGWCPT